MIYVVGGNYREGVNWLADQARDGSLTPIETKEAVIVTNTERLRGRRFDNAADRVVFVGEWSWRKDINEIWDILRTMGWEDA